MITELVNAIADLLASNSFGTVEENLFSITMPGTPFAAVSIAASGGLDLVGDPTRRPTIQILVRDTHVATGLSIATSINALLDDKWNTIPGFPGRMVSQSEPGIFARDENGHATYPLNYSFITTKL